MNKEKELLAGDYVKWFSELDLNSEKIVGRKAARLSFLYKNKIPILEGFVLSCEGVDKLFEIWDIREKIISLLSELKEEDINFEVFKENIKKIILNEDFPEEILQEIFESYDVLSSNKYELEAGSASDILKSASEFCFVSVRSSPEIKIDSENSFLNVKGRAELAKTIKQAIISNYYDYDSLEKNNFEIFNSGIIIQKMIQSEKSGHVFSDSSEGNVLVKGIWGFGLGLDLEDINKDRYVLSKELEILDIKVNEKNFAFVRDSSGSEKVVKLRPERSSFQVLNTYEIQRVADLALKSEFLFKFPVKLQFAIEGEDIFITNVFDLELKKEDVQEEIIKKKIEVKPLSVFTNSQIELIVNDVLEEEVLNKTNIKKAGWIKLDKIIEESKRHRDYYLSYELYKDYRLVLEEKLKKTVSVFEESFISLNDLLSDSFKKLKGSGFIREDNPRLGIHGIRYGLKHLEMLDAEIGAIKNSLEERDGGILIPFITNIKEYKEIREILKARNFNKKVGVIIDNPSAIQLINEYFNYGLDLIIIDFDKIIESLLMVDFDSGEMPKFFDLDNSAVFKQMEYLIRVCKRNEVEIKVKFSSLDEKVFGFFVKKEVNSFLAEIDFFNELSEFIKGLEEKLIEGTDRELREYELKKEKEKRNLEGNEEDLNKEEKVEGKDKNLDNEDKKIEDEKKQVVSEYSVEDLINKKKEEKEKEEREDEKKENIEEKKEDEELKDKSENEKHHELKEEGEDFDSEVEDFLKVSEVKKISDDEKEEESKKLS
jgi:phosphoenolpyruvate synthase/pyruvate phosphate dikinase